MIIITGCYFYIILCGLLCIFFIKEIFTAVGTIPIFNISIFPASRLHCSIMHCIFMIGRVYQNRLPIKLQIVHPGDLISIFNIILCYLITVFLIYILCDKIFSAVRADITFQISVFGAGLILSCHISQIIKIQYIPCEIVWINMHCCELCYSATGRYFVFIICLTENVLIFAGAVNVQICIWKGIISNIIKIDISQEIYINFFRCAAIKTSILNFADIWSKHNSCKSSCITEGLSTYFCASAAYNNSIICTHAERIRSHTCYAVRDIDCSAEIVHTKTDTCPYV